MHTHLQKGFAQIDYLGMFTDHSQLPGLGPGLPAATCALPVLKQPPLNPKVTEEGWGGRGGGALSWPVGAGMAAELEQRASPAVSSERSVEQVTSSPYKFRFL